MRLRRRISILDTRGLRQSVVPELLRPAGGAEAVDSAWSAPRRHLWAENGHAAGGAGQHPERPRFDDLLLKLGAHLEDLKANWCPGSWVW